MGGAPTHPDWYLNLHGEPDAEIQVHGERIPVTARTASDEEKPRLWADRDRGAGPTTTSTSPAPTASIPVVVLSPS